MLGIPGASGRGLLSGLCLAYSFWDGRANAPRTPPVLVRAYPGANHQEQLGDRVGALGDIDGDGLPDFFATGWYASVGSFHNGVVRALSGADGRELWSSRGNTPLADFGRWAELLEDLDGDGYPELVAGARRSSRAAEFGGSFSVLSGRTGRALLVIDGTGVWDGLGSRVASAGDVNGDGHADVLAAEHWPGDGEDVGAHPDRPIRERVLVYSVVPLR